MQSSLVKTNIPILDTKFQNLTHTQINVLGETISFSGSFKNYCVCVVDIVNSTKIIASLPCSKMCKYYSIFLNTMGTIAREFGASVVKNVGDSLLYYFSETSDVSNKLSFAHSLECCMKMINVYLDINKKLFEEHLPPVNYRISADYGMVMKAKSVDSTRYDIFGPPVNMCTKINSLAEPNGMVIGGDLYQIVKFFREYSFKLTSGYSCGLKLQYPVYSLRQYDGKYLV